MNRIEKIATKCDEKITAFLAGGSRGEGALLMCFFMVIFLLVLFVLGECGVIPKG
jgi:hypothetical protein